MELPERPAGIGALSGYTLVANLKARRRLQWSLERRLYKDAVVTARWKHVCEFAAIPVLVWSCCLYILGSGSGQAAQEEQAKRRSTGIKKLTPCCRHFASSPMPGILIAPR